MNYVFLIFSFLFDGYFSTTSFSLFTLTSFFLLLPYLKKNQFYYLMILFGFLMDLIYTTVCGFHVLLFGICALFLLFLYQRFSYHILNLLWEFLIFILFYQSISFFVFPSYISYFEMLFSSLSLNGCYLVFFYFLFHKVRPRKWE